jgi:hypothetical protein
MAQRADAGDRQSARGNGLEHAPAVGLPGYLS